jgi:hypothetical protein
MQLMTVVTAKVCRKSISRAGRPLAGAGRIPPDGHGSEECPPARFDEAGRLLNAGEATREIMNRSGRGAV